MAGNLLGATMSNPSISIVALVLAVGVSMIYYDYIPYITVVAGVLVAVSAFWGRFQKTSKISQSRALDVLQQTNRPSTPTASNDNATERSQKSIMQAKFAAMPDDAVLSGFNAPQWKPTHLFLQEALAEPKFLQGLLGLEETPILQKARLDGWLTKEFDGSLGLVRGGGSASGAVYEVQTEEHFERLKARKGARYDWAICDIGVEGEKEARYGRTFCWRSDVVNRRPKGR